MSGVVQSSAGCELQYIYVILRKLKNIRRTELKLSPRSNALDFENSLFPRRFLLKLIDERLSFLNDLAKQLAAELFRQIIKDVKQNEQSNLPTLAETKRSELDEYFHQSFYHLHDFMIELDWYESDVDDLSKSDAKYIQSKLIHVNKFLSFRKSLATNDASTKAKVSAKSDGNKSPVVSPVSNRRQFKSPPIQASIKSSLSSKKGKLDSPRRRVRFSDSTKTVNQDDDSLSSVQIKSDGYEQSILALDLLIYALNVFVKLLYSQLTNWADSSESTVAEALELLKESKRKLRTNQLLSISKKIKYFIDIYLTVLSYLHDVKNVYLRDYVLRIICTGDTERSLMLYKSPRVESFSKIIGLEVESKIILSLANQCLQLLLDLITSEINLPPVELESDSRTKTRKEVGKSRENYLNFIASWLNFGGNAFESTNKTRKQQQQPNTQEANSAGQSRNTTKTSTLDSGGGPFKSSSRILAQMENLNELMRNIFTQVSDRIRSQQQLRYFLELIYCGVNKSFDLMEPQLSNQLNARRNDGKKLKSTLSSEDLESISKSAELITVRVRCLKLIQILSSLDNQIKDLLNLEEDLLENKLAQFARFVDQ